MVSLQHMHRCSPCSHLTWVAESIGHHLDITIHSINVLICNSSREKQKQKTLSKTIGQTRYAKMWFGSGTLDNWELRSDTTCDNI